MLFFCQVFYFPWDKNFEELKNVYDNLCVVEAALEKGCSHITQPSREPGRVSVRWGVAMDYIEAGNRGALGKG